MFLAVSVSLFLFQFLFRNFCFKLCTINLCAQKCYNLQVFPSMFHLRKYNRFEKTFGWVETWWATWSNLLLDCLTVPPDYPCYAYIWHSWHILCTRILNTSHTPPKLVLTIDTRPRRGASATLAKINKINIFNFLNVQ